MILKLVLAETEGLVGLEPPRVHGFQDWHLDIRVVVDKHALFAFVGPQNPPDVLNQFPLERDWECEKQRVYLRTVKPLWGAPRSLDRF